ncbi:hypothetical protein BD309DRAFT_948583 [Dichomitus squalens]|nr:hypothetical protein BD309DRAFT_948583 [Dichomitus squalens]
MSTGAEGQKPWSFGMNRVGGSNNMVPAHPSPRPRSYHVLEFGYAESPSPTNIEILKADHLWRRPVVVAPAAHRQKQIATAILTNGCSSIVCVLPPQRMRHRRGMLAFH